MNIESRYIENFLHKFFVSFRDVFLMLTCFEVWTRFPEILYQHIMERYGNYYISYLRLKQTFGFWFVVIRLMNGNHFVYVVDCISGTVMTRRNPNY